MFKCTRKDFLLIQNFHLAHYKKFHLLMQSYSREHFYLTANKNPCFVSSHSNITRSNIRSVYQKRFPIYPKCTIYANLLLYKKFHLFIEWYNREHCYLAANKKKHCAQPWCVRRSGTLSAIWITIDHCAVTQMV